MAYHGPLGSPPPLPGGFGSKADLQRWAMAQASSFAEPEFQDAVKRARAVIASDLAVQLPGGAPMGVDQAARWADAYVAAHGLPTTPAAAQAMGESFLSENGTLLGVPPEAIAAVDLVTHMPTSPAEAAEWTKRLGEAYAKQYGIPLSTDGLVRASARAAAVNMGIDPGLIETGIEVFGDGALSWKDAEALTIATAATVGAAAAAALGIPPMIGSMVGSFVAKTVLAFGKDLFGPSDMERQKAAYAKADKARKARMKECARAGEEAWLAYSDYWHSVVSRIELMLTSPDFGPLLAEAGGVRHFYETWQYDPHNPGDVHFCLTPAGKPDPGGCLYYADWYADKTFQIRRDYSSLDAVVGPLVEHGTVELGGGWRGYLDARVLLHYWHADEFPYFPVGGGPPMTDRQAIAYSAEVPAPWVGGGGKIIPQGDCQTPPAIDYLMASIARLQVAASRLQADIVQTVARQAAENALRDLIAESLTPFQRPHFLACVAGKRATDFAACRDMASKLFEPPRLTAAFAQFRHGMTPVDEAAFDVCVRTATPGVDMRSFLPACRLKVLGDPRQNALMKDAVAMAARGAAARKAGSAVKWGLLGAAGVAAFWVIRGSA